jgi:hypothetical protein
MRATRTGVLGVFAVIALCTAAPAQNANPDISVIGDLRAWVNDDESDPKEGELQLDLEGLEVALQGYLNPFARADVFVGYHDDDFELEEAYATILRGLPWGLQLKAGKYRVDFGKLNQLHPHAYSFLDTPLVHQQYFGDHGLVDIGVNLNLQAPVGPTALTVSANLLKGDFAEAHGHEHDHGLLKQDPDDDADDPEEVETELGFSGRVAVFVPTADYAGFEIGVNALHGTLDRHTDRSVEVVGADFKYRWAPDRYRSLTVQGEWLRSERDVLHEHDDGDHELEAISGDGLFAFFDYRFAQRWNAGALYERADAAEEEGVGVERVGVFAGFQVMEETTMVRLLLRQTDHDEWHEPVNEAVLQLLFSLGPHEAHWF